MDGKTPEVKESKAEKTDGGFPVSEVEDDTLLKRSCTTRSTLVPELATAIYRIGVTQLVFGILICCGMGLYIGLNLFEFYSIWKGYLTRFFGSYEVAMGIPRNCEEYPFTGFNYSEGYLIVSMVTSLLVSFDHATL